MDYFSITPEIYSIQSLVSQKNGKITVTALRNFVQENCPTMFLKWYGDNDRLETILKDFSSKETLPDGRRPHRARPTMLARAFISQKWSFEKSTVDSYIKRGRKLVQQRKAP